MIRPDRVSTLARLHLGRMGRHLALTAASVVVLALLDVLKNGIRPESLLGWFFGGAVMFPLLQGMLVIREKTDGSLRFFASLPIAGAEHVAGRAVVAVLLALPAATIAFIGMRISAQALPLSVAIAIALGAAVAFAILAMGLTAMQLRTRIGEGARAALLLFTGLVVLGQVGASLAGTKTFATMRAFVLSRDGLVIASLLVWVALAACAWWSIQTIARVSESYDQDRAGA